MFREIGKSAEISGLFTALPPAVCREPWEKIPADYRNLLVEEGEKWIGHPFPPVYATDFMEFCRTGNRSNYEDRIFERLTALDALVLAECAEYRGRFLDTIINVIFLICGEAAWQLPAHNSYIRDTPQLLLPDVTRPVVDLFAAETGAVLALTEYLLRDCLAGISPAVSVLIDHNLETRIFEPYLEQHFWWMGDGKSPMNNWTSWCTQNVLLAVFTRPLDTGIQKAVMEKACRGLDYFLDEYGEDGCCDEGAQYYRHAGLTLFNAMEILNQVCGGAFEPLYREDKIRNIAEYIMKVHVAGPYYINFADCSPMAGACGVREYLFGKRTDSRGLTAFAAEDYQNLDGRQRLTPEEHNLLYRVQAAFYHKEMMEYRRDGETVIDDVYFPSTGLFIARDRRFCLAVKAGDNGDSHNHNDTGSFTIYRDGQPVFIDVGVESYTKKTFSPQRYEIWTMQSQYHNLPTFGGKMQKDGEEFGASQVEYELGETASRIRMELAGAWEEGSVRSYVREACLEKGQRIVITDLCQGNGEPPVLSLMTYEKPEIRWEEAGRRQGGTEPEEKGRDCRMILGDRGSCRIKGAARICTEEIPITDPRLKTAWHHNIFRTLVTFAGDRVQLVIPEEICL